MIKKIIIFIIFSILSWVNFSYAVPTFEHKETLNAGYKIDAVNRNYKLSDNIRNLFFPGVGGKNIIWEKLKYIAVGLLFIFLIRAGALFVLNADDDGELKKAKNNILYILYGAFLVFGAVWILGKILIVGNEEATATTTIVGTQRDIIGTVLIFLKSAAYYVAILMMVYYGYKIMQAQEKEDKIKAGRNGAINIILALVAIKVLDYVYYIAQKSNLKESASNFLTGISKLLGWGLGVLIILAILYASILLITSHGKEESWKKAKIIIRNIFLVIIVLFLFIVIIYDLIKNFAA